MSAPTPLFTRHMLGAIELERDQRLRRRTAITGPTTRHEPVPNVVEPRIAAVFVAEAPAPPLAALDVDRWVDEGGSFDAGRYPDGKPAILANDFDNAEEARRAAADVHEHARAAAGAGG